MINGLLSLVFAALLAGPAHEPTSAPPRPVLIELYTSQGCPLCPAANEYLGRLDERPDVIALSFSVDYWDIYGWQDTYARPEFVERQRDYKTRMDLARIYTPQFVIDGTTEVGGSRPEGILAQIANRQLTMTGSVEINVQHHGEGNFTIDIDGSVPSPDPAIVYIAAYVPGWRTVNVEGGNNAGREIRVYNPVTAIFELGEWQQGEDSYGAALPEGLAGVFLVQGGNGGPIHGAADFRRSMTDREQP